MKTRLATYRFNETRTVCVGPLAREIRRTIHREQEAALARYDADPSPENRAALLTHEGIERAVAEAIRNQRQTLEAAE